MRKTNSGTYQKIGDEKEAGRMRPSDKSAEGNFR